MVSSSRKKTDIQELRKEKGCIYIYISDITVIHRTYTHIRKKMNNVSYGLPAKSAKGKAKSLESSRARATFVKGCMPGEPPVLWNSFDSRLAGRLVCVILHFTFFFSFFSLPTLMGPICLFLKLQCCESYQFRAADPQVEQHE